MPIIAVSGFVEGINDAVEHLMFAYGRCRRRAYNAKWKIKRKGLEPDRLTIIRQLSGDEGIPARYVVTAYDSMDKLPDHVTFGGVMLQRLHESGKLRHEEYRLRRNAVLACRGEKTCKGNLCLRVDGDTLEGLRVTIGDHKWITLPLRIPERYAKKYRASLNGSRPYTVLLKRRVDLRGYDARIVIEEDNEARPETQRVMALDINSGHVDIAVTNKDDSKPIAFGRFNCSELVNARKEKKRNLTHKLVNKVARIAKHYRAEVVAGKLKTLHSKGKRRMNRKAQDMNQFQMRRIMRYKLPMQCVLYADRSEAYTSKVGAALSRRLGVDVHKAAAYAFCIKVTDNESFTRFLRSVHENAGDGIPNIGLNGGSGPTVLHQVACGNLVHDDAPFGAEATPNQGEGGVGYVNLQTSILQVKV
jgi:IS605 OrfB family transposase